MSSASTVTYTSVYTDSEPERVFCGADEELSDGGSPRVIVYGYDGLPMQPVAPPSPDYVPGPKHPPSPDYVPGPEHPTSPAEPLPADASPVALSPGYVADSDPEEDPKEDPEEDHADYHADEGDDDDEPSNDDDDDTDEEEDEHLAPADFVIAPTVDSIPSSKETEPFENDESAATPPSPPTHRITARIYIRPEAPMPFPSEEEVETLLALPPPLISLSPPSVEEHLARCLAAPALPSLPLPIVPHPYGSPNYVRAPPGFRAAMGRLRASSPSIHHPFIIHYIHHHHYHLYHHHYIYHHREDIPKAELPPHKRLCLTALTSRYEVGESSTAALRPTRGHGIDYRFIGTLDAETRRQRAKEVGYGIRD
ncbi:hypothetical protein Tco_0831021, partial [Tanacetum coccineum]